MEARRALALIMILAGLFLIPVAVLDPLADGWDHDGKWHTWSIDDDGDWSIEWDFDESDDRFEISLTDESGDLVLQGIFDD